MYVNSSDLKDSSQDEFQNENNKHKIPRSNKSSRRSSGYLSAFDGRSRVSSSESIVSNSSSDNFKLFQFEENSISLEDNYTPTRESPYGSRPVIQPGPLLKKLALLLSTTYRPTTIGLPAVFLNKVSIIFQQGQKAQQDSNLAPSRTSSESESSLCSTELSSDDDSSDWSEVSENYPESGAAKLFDRSLKTIRGIKTYKMVTETSEITPIRKFVTGSGRKNREIIIPVLGLYGNKARVPHQYKPQNKKTRLRSKTARFRNHKDLIFVYVSSVSAYVRQSKFLHDNSSEFSIFCAQNFSNPKTSTNFLSPISESFKSKCNTQQNFTVDETVDLHRKIIDFFSKNDIDLRNLLFCKDHITIQISDKCLADYEKIKLDLLKCLEIHESQLTMVKLSGYQPLKRTAGGVPGGSANVTTRNKIGAFTVANYRRNRKKNYIFTCGHDKQENLDYFLSDNPNERIGKIVHVLSHDNRASLVSMDAALVCYEPSHIKPRLFIYKRMNLPEAGEQRIRVYINSVLDVTMDAGSLIGMRVQTFIDDPVEGIITHYPVSSNINNPYCRPLYRAMRITQANQWSRSIHEEGDSGMLITTLPKEESIRKRGKHWYTFVQAVGMLVAIHSDNGYLTDYSLALPICETLNQLKGYLEVKEGAENAPSSIIFPVPRRLDIVILTSGILPLLLNHTMDNFHLKLY